MSVDPASFASLPLMLSPARFTPYLAAHNQDHDRALRLYTWNVEVSSAFWGVLHAVEIAMRNAMHEQLAKRYAREDWWLHPRVQLHKAGQAMVDGAVDSAARTAQIKRRPAVPGDVVASLSFGFWTGLTGKGGAFQYETKFWQPALTHAFPNFRGKRSDVSKTLESVRLFRNRVAHHEPIFKRHLSADHATLLRVAGYINGDLESYASSHSRVPLALSRRSGCVHTGIGTSF